MVKNVQGLAGQTILAKAPALQYWSALLLCKCSFLLLISWWYFQQRSVISLDITIKTILPRLMKSCWSHNTKLWVFSMIIRGGWRLQTGGPLFWSQAVYQADWWHRLLNKDVYNLHVLYGRLLVLFLLPLLLFCSLRLIPSSQQGKEGLRVEHWEVNRQVKRSVSKQSGNLFKKREQVAA